MPSTPGTKRTLKAVVVDNDSALANTFAVILSRNGFATAALYSGLAALQLCYVARPDLVIIDLLMPTMDGIETATRIHQLHPDCPILFCTGAGDIQEFVSALQAQGHPVEVLEKPVSPGHLIMKARQYATRTAPVQQRKVA